MSHKKVYTPRQQYILPLGMMKYSKALLTKFTLILTAPILVFGSIGGFGAQCCYFLQDFADTYAFWIIVFFLVLTCLTLSNNINHLYAYKDTLLSSSPSQKTQFSSTKTRFSAKLVYKTVVQYLWRKF